MLFVACVMAGGFSLVFGAKLPFGWLLVWVWCSKVVLGLTL